jgi:hypothetical protein
MQITKANYFDLDTDREYMSHSQYLGFQRCEARQMAILSGEWTEAPSEAMLIGQYVHAWCEGKLDEFIQAHPEMFTKSGTLRAGYQQANKMIATLAADPLCMYMLEGQKEVVFTAEFAGAKWRVMVDVYNPERRRIVDLKTTRSIWEATWSERHGGRVSFIEQYDYPLQAALYCEIERLASGRPDGDWFEFYMVAVSKDNVPDKEVIDLRDPERYRKELDSIRGNMGRILSVKAGELEPIRCESCDYCRATKVLRGAVYYADI